MLAQALDLDMTTYFKAMAESYFIYLTRDGIEAALTEIKGPDFASGIGRMKKAEAAAYAEAQTKGTAWLPSPIRPAKAATTVADRLSVDGDSDDEAANMTDDASEADEAEGDMMQFPEAAE